MRPRGVIAALLVVVSSAVSVPAVAGPTSAPVLDRFFSQTLIWTRCERGSSAQCADVMVPLDYSDPAGRTITVGIARQAATGSRHGVILFNPGGPGGSGTDFVLSGIAQFPEPLRRHFDIVGLDPRGVGRSTQVKCGPQPGGPDIIPTSLAEGRAAQRQLQAWIDRCVSNSGRVLLAHMGTRDAARDMDVIREVLGQATLNYLGISYGTYLGAVYADLFPDRVGRLVLDSNMSTTLDYPGLALSQARGFQRSFDAWARWCARYVPQCPHAGSRAGAQITADFAVLKDNPVRVPGGRPFGYSEAMALLGAGFTYGGNAGWEFAVSIASLVQARAGKALRRISASFNAGSDPANELAVNLAVDCFDRPGGTTVVQTLALSRLWGRRFPTFGAGFAWSANNCTRWPVASSLPSGPLSIDDVPPVLLLGVQHDPNTPISGTWQMHDQIAGSRVVVWEGMGHGASLRGVSCIDDAVSAYFLRGRLPAPGTRCLYSG